MHSNMNNQHRPPIIVDGQDVRFMTSIGFQQLFLKKLGNVINPADKKQDAEVEVQPVYERNKLNIRVRNVVKPKALAVTVEGSSKNQSKLLSQQESGRNQ